MATLSFSTQSATHLLSMSAPIGSLTTAIDPSSEFPTEGSVSATHPVEYFSVLLYEPALVVLRMQEANTASRCALFLSCTTTKPNANSASWRLISPEPVKQLVLHPADPSYRVGVLTIAVHYLEQSGQSSFQLRAQVRRDFFAMWLRTGEVPRRAGAVAPNTLAVSSSSKKGESGHHAAQPGSPTLSRSAKAMNATLHGVLSNAGGHAAANTRGSLFTSLYIGDWRGNQREGLGFQYYAAPDDAAGGDIWQRAAPASGSEEGEDVAAADEMSISEVGNVREDAEGNTRAASDASPLSPHTSAAALGSLASPLLLLRAFSERHNLPWSAWSIPDTLTPEELAKLGFGHSFHPPASRPDKTEPREGPPRFPTFVKTHSPQSSPTLSGASGPSFSSSSPPVAPRATAVEGLSVLGSVIDRLVMAEIRDAELGQWSVLPVQAGVEVYAGEWAANCKDGRGFYQWLDRSYVGEWVAGRREGFGLLRRKDGGWYRGQWERHVPHGVGEAHSMPENLLYKGEWRRGCRSGHGCLTYPDGTAVHGEWVANVLQPHVHTVYADGSTYDGAWGADACREGHGTLTDTAGCRHIHTWSHNTRVGEGREVYPNGVVLEGTWQDDVLTSAVYVFPSGERYVGDMDAQLHVRQGTGRCTSADGLSIYTGGWSKDERSGHGVFVRHRKTSTDTAPATAALPSAADPVVIVEFYEGGWRHNMRCGSGHQENEETVYVGTFESDCRDGTGLLRNARTGSFYEGQWSGDRRCGAGAYYSATKDTTYEGVFLNDRLTGTGTATKGASAEQYSGLWVDGVEHGHGSLRLANGDTLRGVWHRGRPEADTSVEYVDAAERGAVRESRYVGGWRDAARHGNGTQVFSDGSVYEGAWEHNKQHGRGRRTAASGESVECEWVGGAIAPGCVATVHFADGSVYVGSVNAAGVPHGAGVLTYPDGTVFDGQFAEGIYQL